MKTKFQTFKDLEKQIYTTYCTQLSLLASVRIALEKLSGIKNLEVKILGGTVFVGLENQTKVSLTYLNRIIEETGKFSIHDLPKDKASN